MAGTAFSIVLSSFLLVSHFISFGQTSEDRGGRIPETCGTGHAGVRTLYDQSIHGQALKKGLPQAPIYTDCHSAHQIQRVEKEKMPTPEKKEKEREVYHLRLSLFHGLMHVLVIPWFPGAGANRHAFEVQL